MKFLFVVVALAACTVESPAYGQPVCGDREQIVRDLAGKYKEQQVGYGVDNKGRLVEIWASPEGTYTMLATLPGGLTCLLSVGDGWQVQALKGVEL